MMWPFKRKPEIEQRASPGVTLEYMDRRRRGLLTDGKVPHERDRGHGSAFLDLGLCDAGP